MREFIIQYSGPGGSSGLSVLYADASLLPDNQLDDLQAFLTALAPEVSNQATMFLPNEGREIDPVTGALTGQWQGATQTVVTGTGGTSVVSNADQVLIRWSTDEVLDGRFIKGRMFLPNVAGSANAGGEVAAVPSGNIAGAAQDMAIAVGLYVWHRPRPAKPAGPGGVPPATTARDGAAVDVVTATVWREFAVLRGRRG
uniref:Uncharacterized protein n=1 Tax=uncultured prokaryote TaxID=198431 RepID=A0A0H5Q6E3_9ZZZZ|nr:hypothetical protein [uncultured prokaryote]